MSNTLVFLIVTSSGSIGSESFERSPPPPPIHTLHWYAADRPEYGRPRTLATRYYRTICMCARLERRGGVRNSRGIWLCRAKTPLLGAGLSQGTVLPTVGKPGPGDIHNRPSVLMSIEYGAVLASWPVTESFVIHFVPQKKPCFVNIPVPIPIFPYSGNLNCDIISAAIELHSTSYPA